MSYFSHAKLVPNSKNIFDEITKDIVTNIYNYLMFIPIKNNYKGLFLLQNLYFDFILRENIFLLSRDI